MNFQFRPFIQTSCLETGFEPEYEMGDGSLTDSATKRNLARKLSFTESFESSNDSTDEPGDYLSEQASVPQQKFAEEIPFSEFQPKKPSIFFPLKQNQNAINSPSFSFLSNSTRMEEEFNEMPTYEELPRGKSLMEIFTENNNKNNTPSMKENRPPFNKRLSLNTNLGFSRQTDSPISCFVKSHSTQQESLHSPTKRFNNSALMTCKNLRDPDLRTITPETLIELIQNPNGQKYLVIDCRYEYEYQGGHIQSAINVTSPEDLEELLIKNKHLLCQEETLEMIKRDWQIALGILARQKPQFSLEQNKSQDSQPPILIFHCEFSQKRGPRALRALRNLDRALNQANWPNLSYPEVYILENGYQNFHSKYPGFCDPINQYIRMADKTYKEFYIEAKLYDRKVWKNKNAVKGSPKLAKLPRFNTADCL